MKPALRRLVFVLVGCGILIIGRLCVVPSPTTNTFHDNNVTTFANSSRVASLPVVTLSAVACGHRYEEALVMIKSALALTRGPIHIHLFADNNLIKSFRQKELLPELDSVIYIDTDTVFLRPVSEIWKIFTTFSDEQLMAMTRETEGPSTSWYSGKGIPYVPRTGVNSGVLLMNLTRMRTKNLANTIIEHYFKYREKLETIDQDLLNIYFHFYPERLYLLSCDWNYRTDHCQTVKRCQQADLTGVSLMHGNSFSFRSRAEYRDFSVVYQAFRDYHLKNGSQVEFLNGMVAKIRTTPITACNEFRHLFTKQLAQHIIRHTT